MELRPVRPPPFPPPRLSVTAAARRLIAQLRQSHGPLLLHQARAGRQPGPPLCFVQGDFPLLEMDVLLGEIDGTPFYVSHGRFQGWGPAPVRLDAVPGRAGLFSLERRTGLRFSTRPGDA